MGGSCFSAGSRPDADITGVIELASSHMVTIGAHTVDGADA